MEKLGRTRRGDGNWHKARNARPEPEGASGTGAAQTVKRTTSADSRGQGSVAAARKLARAGGP